ncbi:hypothetical protein TFLX_03941 [Thermoflexales bacterium]|nr:hypothetical protein TFLX_03941 [Thermoflexales bacterium]
MNTLSRAITSRFFTNPQDYSAFRKQWSTLLNSDRKHDLTATHHLLYLALCGKDWRKAFTLARNRRKLENGAYAGWALWRALSQIHWTRDEAALLGPFEGLLTPEMLQQIRTWLPKPNAYVYRPEQFADRQWPFEAYLVVEATLRTNE